MRLLLDESVPTRLRLHLPGNSVKMVVEMGWGGVTNGALLALAAPQFYSFINVDKNLPYQQNLASLLEAVIVSRAGSNELPRLLPLIPMLEEALAGLQPGRCIQLGPLS